MKDDFHPSLIPSPVFASEDWKPSSDPEGVKEDGEVWWEKVREMLKGLDLSEG